jgi:hypothetical protein
VPDEQNGALLCRKAFDLMEKLPLTPEEEAAAVKLSRGKSLTDKERGLLIRWRQEDAPLFEMLREASRYPACQFSVDIDQTGSARDEHVFRSMEASRLLRWDAAVAALEGDLERAPMNAAVTMWLARAIRNDPAMFAQITAATTEELALGMLGDGTGMADPGLEAPFQGLDASLIRDAFVRSVGESVYPVIRSLMIEKPELAEWTAPVSAADMARYVDSMISFIQLAQEPHPQAAARVMSMQAQWENSPGMMERLTVTGFFGALEAMRRAQSRAAMAQLIRQLEIYHKRSGRYPPDLSALPVAATVDPLTGRALAYAPEGAGYVLANGADKREMYLEWRSGQGWVRPAPQPEAPAKP